jgi:hypothetical protein
MSETVEIADKTPVSIGGTFWALRAGKLRAFTLQLIVWTHDIDGIVWLVSEGLLFPPSDCYGSPARLLEVRRAELGQLQLHLSDRLRRTETEIAELDAAAALLPQSMLAS